MNRKVSIIFHQFYKSVETIRRKVFKNAQIEIGVWLWVCSYKELYSGCLYWTSTFTPVANFLYETRLQGNMVQRNLDKWRAKRLAKYIHSNQILLYWGSFLYILLLMGQRILFVIPRTLLYIEVCWIKVPNILSKMINTATTIACRCIS